MSSYWNIFASFSGQTSAEFAETSAHGQRFRSTDDDFGDDDVGRRRNHPHDDNDVQAGSDWYRCHSSQQVEAFFHRFRQTDDGVDQQQLCRQQQGRQFMRFVVQQLSSQRDSVGGQDRAVRSAETVDCNTVELTFPSHFESTCKTFFWQNYSYSVDFTSLS